MMVRRSMHLTDFQTLFDKYNSVKDTIIADKLITTSGNNAEVQSAVPPLNINVSCDRGLSSDLTKIKFDRKSCVRSFIQLITEFSKVRNISSDKLLPFSTEIFTGDALHWYRGV